jgi:hypothetical protein
MSNPRKYTAMLLDMVEEGVLDKDNVILACVKYMSESDVEDMMRANEMIIDDEDSEEEEEVNDEDE